LISPKYVNILTHRKSFRIAIDEITEKVRSFLEEFSTETIASIAGWDYIISAIVTVA